MQGQAWQLKEFPFKARMARLLEVILRCRAPMQGAADGNFVETFANVSAFFVRFDSEPAPEFVKKWSVSVLTLARNTRHGDASVIERNFWRVMDQRLASKRSPLSY